MANKIWWIEDHEIKEYPGTYEEWEWWYNREQEKKKSSPQPQNSEKKEKAKVAVEKPRHDDAQKQLEEEIAQLEGKIEALES